MTGSLCNWLSCEPGSRLSWRLQRFQFRPKRPNPGPAAPENLCRGIFEESAHENQEQVLFIHAWESGALSFSGQLKKSFPHGPWHVFDPERHLVAYLVFDGGKLRLFMLYPYDPNHHRPTLLGSFDEDGRLEELLRGEEISP